MPDRTAILGAFRGELIAAGLVRAVSRAGVEPPMIVEPLEGPPGPGDELDEGLIGDPDLVLSLVGDGDLSEATGYDAAAQRRTVITVHYRTRNAPALRRAEALDAAIRARLIRPETNYGYGFRMGGLFVLEAAIFGGMGPVGRSREGGYHHAAKYLVAVAP